MAKAKRRKGRRVKRSMVIHRYRYYETVKFFEPHFFIRMSLHVFHRNHTMLHIFITKKEKGTPDEEILYRKWHDDKYVANSRKFLSLVNKIDKVDKNTFDLEAVEKLLSD